MEFILLTLLLSCIFLRFKEITVIILLACLVVFLWEYKIIQVFSILAIIVVGIIHLRKYLLQNEKYKNETPEERKKREELEKVREWSKRNNC